MNENVPTRWVVVSMALFVAGIALGGCAASRQRKAEQAALREYREQVIPACNKIVDAYNADEAEIKAASVRIGLCDDLNSALNESNQLLREKASKCAEPKKKKRPSKKYQGDPDDLEPS